MTATFGCVVLTQGGRPDELRRGIESVLAQRGATVDLVVVGNGWQPEGLPDGVRALGLESNIGATAGRNAGVGAVAGDILVFLDDDAALPEPDALASIATLFDADPRLGVVQPRVVDPVGRPPQRRHVPRLRVGNVRQSGDVTSFWEGAVAIRRSVFDQVGGFDEQMWYGHEGMDFAWRVLDAGYRVHYAGHVVANHPAIATPPHDFYRYITARNRVWVARRYLPWPVAALHLAVWFVLSAVRLRTVSAAVQTAKGWRDGFVQPAGVRRPMRWRTVWRMTKLGRPPVI